jgi:uncharacterized membrane protein
VTPLLSGLVLLFVLQQVHANVTLRSRLIRDYGLLTCRCAAAALVLVALALLIHGKSSTPYQFVWLPPAWLQLLVLPGMFVAFIFLAAALVPSKLRAWTREPASVAVVLWALAHLFIKENLAAITVFGGLGLLALIELGYAMRRPAAQPARSLPWLKESVTVATGGVLFLIAFYLHAAIVGVAPISMSRGFL